jgi:serine/threonine-protein kinase
MPYTWIKHLGSGQFGNVSLEYDEGLDRRCATKRVPSTGMSPYTEPQTLLAMSHSNVVQVFTADEEEDTGDLVIRMEYHEPGSLHNVYSRTPRWTHSVVQHVEQACRGLQHLHTQEVLHRDIKPGNLLLSVGDVVMLCDFGLSQPLSTVDSGAPVGYLAHLPPESIDDSQQITTAAGDIYAMGVTLYRLLEGDEWLQSMRGHSLSPFLADIRAGSVPPRTYSPHIPNSLRRVIEKATAKRPEDRFESAMQLRHALEATRSGVSWHQTNDGIEQLKWNGTNPSSSTCYLAAIKIARSGRWSFEITKTFSSGFEHRLRRLERQGLTRRQACEVARRVMNDASGDL